jgi:hypothetical protein
VHADLSLLGSVVLHLLAAFLAHWGSPHALPMLVASRRALAVGGLVCCFRLFSMMSLSQSLGVLFISCVRMYSDIKRWAVVLGLVCVGFGLTFSGMLSADELAASPTKALATEGAAAGGGECGGEAPTLGEPFLVPFWALHGETLGFEALQLGNGAGIVLWIYFMLSQVVLLNLLVAIMGDTWGEVKESADVEWRFLFVESIEEFFDMPHVPPPFNARLLVRHFGSRLLGRSTRSRSDSGERVRRGIKLSAGDIKK